MSPSAQRVFDSRDLVAFHRRLQRIDRIDLGHDHARAHAAQRLRGAFAHIAVAADDRDFAGQHDVGGALDAVGQRFAAAVEIVELRFGDRIVDVDRRNQQLAFLLHLVQPVHAGGRLFRNAAPVRDHVVPALRILRMHFLQQILDHLLFVAARRAIDPVAAFFEFVAFVDQQRDIAAVINDQLRAFAVRDG